jgi:hypothetical protein
MDLNEVAAVLRKFGGTDLSATLSRIESSVRGVSRDTCASVLAEAGADNRALTAAAALKRVAGQINVAIHAIGILLCLPHILEADEKIEYVSLGAGNAGREFDLETSHRIAEFKFIHWRGGSESIRQNQIFKDFYLLAQSPSPKRKFLYVLGTQHPLRFFNRQRALSSVLSRNDALLRQFQAAHGERYTTVRDYYVPHQHLVTLADVSEWVPELITDAETEEL